MCLLDVFGNDNILPKVPQPHIPCRIINTDSPVTFQPDLFLGQYQLYQLTFTVCVMYTII